MFNYLKNLMSAACTLLGPLPDSIHTFSVGEESQCHYFQFSFVLV